jgi:hypothetical protein
MSYSGSSSFSGAGSILSIQTGGASSSPVFTVINEIASANLTGRQAKTSDCTNFSSGKVSEFLSVIVDSGSIDIKANYVAADAGQSALSTAFSSLTKTLFSLQLPLSPAQLTTGDLYKFPAIVSEFSFDVNVEKQIELSAKLKISGALTLVSGS